MELVDVAAINVHDRRFCVSFPVRDDLLLDSIRKVGIISPLVMLDTSPHVAVTGFKRLDAALRLGLKQVPCIIVLMDEQSALRAAIHDNVTRTLNTVEKAQALEKMTRMGFPLKETSETMRLLGFEPHEKVLKTLAAIGQADERTKGFILEHRVTISGIEQFLSFDPAERSRIIDLLGPLHTTRASFREILQALALSKVKAGSIDFDGLSGGTSLEELALRLHRTTHPILSSLEDRLNEIRVKAALPPQVDIKVDPYFEKERVDILIKAANQEEVESAIRKLETLSREGLFRSIFELTRGVPNRN